MHIYVYVIIMQLYLGWSTPCCLHFITLYFFYMKTFTISNCILKAFSIFVCILAAGFKHMFSRFLAAVHLKTIFVKKIESLGKKIKKFRRSFNNHYQYIYICMLFNCIRHDCVCQKHTHCRSTKETVVPAIDIINTKILC